MSDMNIIHDECMGFEASFGITFIGDDVFCIKSGNFLQICQQKDRALEILSSINGELTGFSSMASSPLSRILAYADSYKKPFIHFMDINAKEVGRIQIQDVLGIQSMDISYDGEWLYVLGGLPSFRLSAFNMETKEEVAFRVYEQPHGKHISCSPSHPRLFAVYGDASMNLPELPPELMDEPLPRLRFYTLHGCREQYTLVDVAAQINSSVIALTWSPRDECIVATEDGLILTINPLTGEVTAQFEMNSLNDSPQIATALYCTPSYLIVSGSTGNIYWLSLSDMSNTSDISILEAGSPIEFFRIFPRSNKLMFGTRSNSLMCVDLDERTHQVVENSLTCLRETHQGPITSLCSLPHQIVTCGSDGTIRFWSSSPYLSLSNKFTFKNESFTYITSSKGGTLVAVGSQSGVLRIINTLHPDEPVLLYRERLHSTAITSIVISDEIIASGSVSGSVVIIKTEPNMCFPLIGLLQLHTTIVSLALPPPLPDTKKQLGPQLLIATSHKEIHRITVPKEVPENYNLQIESLNRVLLKISNKMSMIIAEPTLREEQQYFFCACDDRTVKYYCVPVTTGDLDIVGSDDVEASSPDDVFSGHSKNATSVALSPTQNFVASGCSGATFIVRELDATTAQVKRVILTATHHSLSKGAISGIAFSPDGRKIFTVGYDGCINSYTLRVNPCALLRDSFQPPSDDAAFTSSVSRRFEIDHQIKSLAEIWRERVYSSSENNSFQADDGNGIEELPLVDQIKREKTKIQQKEIDEFRSNITSQLSQIKTEFMDLIEKNESAPELEKLTKSDFTLDVQASERLQNLAKLRQQLIYYRRRIKNQIRSLITQQITERCYQPYEPKLTTVYSFKTPIKFDNFPLPVVSEKDKRRLKCVQLLRRTEIAALRYKAPQGSSIDVSQYRDSALDAARYLYSRSNSLVQLIGEDESETDMIVKRDQSLLYDPFQLMTANRKVTQIIIVQNIIFDAMNQFNSIFDDMLSKKVSAVQSLNEKNKRVRQLVRLLKLDINDYQLFDPPPYYNEDPESFLSVRDEEVILKKIRDEGGKKDEKTDELAKDSFAERALKQMMGANVNVNALEEAPNDDEPIAPEWMTTKKLEEMTEEEQYQVQEFEKKKKLFFEEREKRKKMLSAELTKVYKSCSSIIEEFDLQMTVAYMQRFDTEEQAYYHELEVLHLIEALDKERHLRHVLNSLGGEFAAKQELYKQKSHPLAELSAEATNATKSASATEDNLESLKSQIQKEFKNRDCLQQLMKWYNYSIARRVRPKVSSGPNTFAQFLSPSIDFSSAMDEILNPANRPASLPDQSWKNFLEYCETKIRVSKEAAERSAEAHELKALEATLRSEIDELHNRLSDLGNEQNRVTDELLNTLIDMHVPFTFRQGQVEIPSDTVLLDYSDVLLLDRNVVVARNQLVLEAGAKKISELEAIRRQHSEHKELKWQISKCNVDLQNLKEEIQEYQLFRVTKYDLELIRNRFNKGPDGESMKNINEVKSLQNGLDHMIKQHATRMGRGQEALRKLHMKVAGKKRENDSIENEITQMQLGLKERKRIYNIQMKSSEGAQDARKRRLKQVMMISKLKRAKSIQEMKIAELEKERDRLRRCVYTSFDDEETDTMVGYKS